VIKNSMFYSKKRAVLCAIVSVDDKHEEQIIILEDFQHEVKCK
jgi:hypothetical protein